MKRSPDWSHLRVTLPRCVCVCVCWVPELKRLMELQLMVLWVIGETPFTACRSPPKKITITKDPPNTHTPGYEGGGGLCNVFTEGGRGEVTWSRGLFTTTRASKGELERVCFVCVGRGGGGVMGLMGGSFPSSSFTSRLFHTQQHCRCGNERRWGLAGPDLLPKVPFIESAEIFSVRHLFLFISGCQSKK